MSLLDSYVACSNKSCCPELLVYETDKVEIHDDYNQIVTMTKEQIKLIAKHVEELKAQGKL